MVKKCDECGKIISFGGSWKIDGRILCSSCERDNRIGTGDNRPRERNTVKEGRSAVKEFPVCPLCKSPSSVRIDRNLLSNSIIYCNSCMARWEGHRKSFLLTRRGTSKKGMELQNQEKSFDQWIRRSREVIPNDDILISSTSIAIKCISGNPMLIGKNVTLELYRNRICICKHRSKDGLKFKILLENLKGIQVKTERQINEEERSVIGRAVAGGLLFGGVGAMVGGMSGTKSKKTTQMLYYMVLDYISKEGSNKKFMFFTFSQSLSIWEAKFLKDIGLQLEIMNIKQIDSKGEMEL